MENTLFFFQVDTSLADAPVDLINQFCTLDPYEATEGCNYIDLIKNEEKYTGYQVRFRIPIVLSKQTR